jgi:SAM-dependent methyltransferase
LTPTQTRIGYALPNAWELSRRRLDLLAATHDPTSIRCAEALGVGPGWRCLEAGAGQGSFARWLGSRVGSTGGVVAADMDVRLLEGIDVPNLEVRQMDLETGDLPEAAFDFVHTRYVLMHLPSRDDVLRRLAAAVRPGGVLMIEEGGIHPIPATAHGPYLEAWQAFHRMMERAGVDTEWAWGSPGRLVDLGLVDVGAEFDGEIFRGGSALAQFWSLTWPQVRERIMAAGSPGHVVDDGRAALDDASRWFHGPATVIAWGRRAAG